MRLFLVDRLADVVPWQSARGTKLVSASEDFIQTGAGGAFMPRGLVLECAFQTAAWLIVTSSSLKLRPAVLSVSGVHWFAPVRPGDRLETVVRVLQHSDDVAEVCGESSVDGNAVLRVESGICALLPTSDLDTPGGAEWMMRQLTRCEMVRA